MTHRRTTIARAEMAHRMRGEGKSAEEIARLMHATAKTVRFLLSVADESRVEPATVGPTPKERKCVACGETKPLVEFYKGEKGYYTHRCRPCHLARFRELHQRRREREMAARTAVVVSMPEWPQHAQLWSIGCAPNPESVLRELSEARA